MSDGDTRPDGHPYDAPHLARTPANHAALTPLGFLERAAAIYPDKLAVIEPAPAKAGGERRFTYRQFYDRARRFADALRRRGIGRGDSVSVLAPNVPALLEAHYAVPMAGAVLNALNTRLDPASVAFILEHGEAKVLLVDTEWVPVVKAALPQTTARPTIVDIVDPAAPGERLGGLDYGPCWGRATPPSPGCSRTTSGTRSRSATPRVRPAIPRAWSTIIEARS
jgi:fatty-acyl-CoA synthase